MKDIDFLPARYHQRTRLRRAMAWRVAALGVLAAIVLVVHGGQLAMRRSLKQQLLAIAQQHVKAMEVTSRSQRLQTDLAAGQQYAELYTYLQYPWPPTQLLAAIAQTMPAHLTLTEIHIAQRVAEKAAAPPAAAPNAGTPEPPQAKRDLQTLRAENDSIPSVVTISGTTTDASELQVYVAGFNRSPFFVNAKLESLESLKGIDGPPTSRFELQLVVRPGYGQPGGPVAGVSGGVVSGEGSTSTTQNSPTSTSHLRTQTDKPAPRPAAPNSITAITESHR